jgi:hypothetical protein
MAAASSRRCNLVKREVAGLCMTIVSADSEVMSKSPKFSGLQFTCL